MSGCLLVVDPKDIGLVLGFHAIRQRHYRACIAVCTRPDLLELIQSSPIRFDRCLLCPHATLDEATRMELRAISFPVQGILMEDEYAWRFAQQLVEHVTLAEDCFLPTTWSTWQAMEVLRASGAVRCAAPLHPLRVTQLTAQEYPHGLIETNPANRFCVPQVLIAEESAWRGRARQIVRNNRYLGLGHSETIQYLREHVPGQTYLLDFVSRGGQHKLISMFECTHTFLRDRFQCRIAVQLVACNLDVERLFLQAALDSLNALGTVNGCSSIEIGVKEEGGQNVPIVLTYQPYLHSPPEIANLMVLYDNCLEMAPYQKLLTALHDPSGFDKLRDIPLMRKFGAEVGLFVFEAGVIHRMPKLGGVPALASCHAAKGIPKPGQFICGATTSEERLGYIQLLHANAKTFRTDLRNVLKWVSQSAETPYGAFELSVTCRTSPGNGPTAIIVDPYSTGDALSRAAGAKGMSVTHAFTMNPSAMVPGKPITNLQGRALVSDIFRTAARSRLTPMAVLAGAEMGVELADKLAQIFRVRGNNPNSTAVRRNKYAMHERLASRGLRSAKQALIESPEDVNGLVHAWGGDAAFPAVVKPVDSAGTDNVYLCRSVEDVQKAVSNILGHVNINGTVNDECVMMEYLQGTEYVVDGVSRDGVHKVVALWVYDKGQENDSDFVYRSMTLCEGTSQPDLLQYFYAVLAALEVTNGATHAEIMLTTKGPVLVEIAARAHGGGGTWLPLVRRCIGYDQLEVAVAAACEAEEFEKFPSVPKLRANGREVFLISHTTGVVTGIPGLNKCRTLSSFTGIHLIAQVQRLVHVTKNIPTRPGSVLLCNASIDQINRDTEAIRALERESRFFLTSPLETAHASYTDPNVAPERNYIPIQSLLANANLPDDDDEIADRNVTLTQNELDRTD